MTSDQVVPWHMVTIKNSEKVLGQGLYLPEIGDKLIKMAFQFIVKHLNWVMEKINEKKSLATERILFILEDLNQL
jgi:hypothetical protein